MTHPENTRYRVVSEKAQYSLLGAVSVLRAMPAYGRISRVNERLEHGFFKCISAINRKSDEAFFLNITGSPGALEQTGRDDYLW